MAQPSRRPVSPLAGGRPARIRLIFRRYWRRPVAPHQAGRGGQAGQHRVPLGRGGVLQDQAVDAWRPLALSLWACGRQADALAARRQARRLLRDELGLDPGPALADLEKAILGQRQEVLDRAASVPVLPAERPVRPTATPAPEPAPGEADVFAGRDAELQAITAWAAANPRPRLPPVTR
jgi:hypothetical protein